jgi:hypothetical protein
MPDTVTAPMRARDPATLAVAEEAHAAVIQTGRALPVWTISKTGDGYLARLGFAKAGLVCTTEITIADPELALLRAVLPVGLIRFDRTPSDPAEIVETWL